VSCPEERYPNSKVPIGTDYAEGKENGARILHPPILPRRAKRKRKEVSTPKEIFQGNGK